MTKNKKEMCTACNKNINIGEKLCICHNCNKIVHAKCYVDSNFLYRNGNIYCKSCCNDQSLLELRYNPFKLKTSKNESDKLYDVEPTEYDPLMLEIVSLLEKCKSNNITSFKKSCKSLMSSFSTYFLNIDGNYTNVDSFSGELDRYEHKFSVIGIVETNVDKCNRVSLPTPGLYRVLSGQKAG